MIITLKYRVKDATSGKQLNRYAIACNQVWNLCVETQKEAQRRWEEGIDVKWPTAFDLINLNSGSSARLGIYADTISEICQRFVASRNQHKRCPRFRSSFGSKRSLGWVPFKGRAIRIDGDSIIYLKRKFRFWKSRDLEGAIKTGAFVQDARGRWYVTFQYEVAEDRPTGTGRIGIDLGLKALATCSDGTAIPALRHYRKYEAALAVQQRAGNKHRVRTIHAKIANARRNHLHEWTTKLARENELIVVGNISPAKLAKTRMAKSVLDASWSMLRAQLAYKARRHRARYVEADERFTTQTCSSCGTVPDSSPKGIGALGMRHWVCSDCGAHHDRDVNAALNILRVGLECQTPVEDALAA